MRTLSPVGISNYDKYNLFFTYSYRGETVPIRDLQGNVVLDTNGTFYSLRDASSKEIRIVIIGGLNKHIYAKNSKPPLPFFITRLQKVALYKLVQAVSMNTDSAEFDCENLELQLLVDSLYSNFTG